MSKIAEKKALKEYPKDYAYAKCDEDETNYCEIDSDGIKWLKVDINKTNRDCYIKGYDQAMQDFMEKACDYLQKNLWRVVIEDGEFRQRFVTDFKNYIQNESEN